MSPQQPSRDVPNKERIVIKRAAFLTLSMAMMATPAMAQSSPPDQDGSSSNAQLAEKLSNPVASLISVPFQFNYDSKIGPDQRGRKNYLNLQPVVPVSISDDWKS